ncbi:MAG: D-2-hydroxyacid dehydrogenase [Clostridia bacterium]
MKLIILDGRTVVGNDLNWDCFAGLGDISVYDRTPREETIARIGDAEAIFINKVIIDKEILNACPRLKYIGLFATGYNVVDIAAARERGIVVTNVPSYSTDSVAQMTFAMILETACNVSLHSQSVHNGEWQYSPDFCFWKVPLVELAGKTLGIVGFGSIGRQVANIARAFKMNVLFATRTQKNESVSLKYLLENSDYVSLHCPLNNENKGMINKSTLALMKPSAYLINTARGGLVNEADLADALNNNIIAGACLDVVSSEPISATNPVLSAKNCILTPHIAWAPKETRMRLLNVVVDNFIKWREGKSQNDVTKKV